MIKFFRKIRQNLLSEGKTGKYFKYAIGEIILVVIGILIALGINNWNLNRIETKQTKTILNSMILDLESDISNLESDIVFFENDIQKSRIVLNSEKFDRITEDSLYNLLPTNSSSYSLNRHSFEKLKNSGINNILDSDELYESISAYYTDNADILNTVNSWDFDYSLKATDFWRLGNEFEGPILNDTIITRYRDGDIIRKTKLVQLVSSMKSRNIIRYAISRKLTCINVYKGIKFDAENLIKIINQELGLKK
ncbi:DUF6090 family protein [Ichthyenterobacterium sp. W332]|uniref:DUF6090 family protein n=1 Tax=Microcosmobacter mediterraneus TaxID=3075607 RepID=A0ABU2YN08_9FLAO|nr:DUF6090 family protein [Ichthyenterobacterium sp. W332]MDT0559548.1 DUF6090 family protein [Ichthyenterobacterium sp. W332]